MTIKINGDNTVANPGFSGDDTDTGLQVGTNELKLVTGGTEAVTVNSSQNVGIGTDSPFGKLHVQDDTNNLEMFLIGPSTGSSRIRFGDNADTNIGQIIYDNTSDSLQVHANNAERMRIDSSGNVGIGTTSPTNQLHIFDDSGANDKRELKIEAFRPGIRFQDRSTNAASAEIVGDSALIFNVSAPVNDTTALTERVRINSAGEFLVGKSDGATTTNGLTITSAGRLYDTIPNGNTYHVYDSTNSLYRFYVKSNGGVANYSGNNSNLSDERLKKNIESLDSTWECLKNWELKKFHYSQDSDTDDKKYGVIAQQIAPHCPEVIDDFIVQPAEDAILDEDGNVVAPATEEVVRMGVKEGQMMWMAIKALQEAIAKIETLEIKVAALENA